ncbi:MAG: hypothetical protein Q8K57_07575 [Thiobacillus sp.]|nr:hypothetical protein [Thiobacillus sp.]
MKKTPLNKRRFFSLGALMTGIAIETARKSLKPYWSARAFEADRFVVPLNSALFQLIIASASSSSRACISVSDS